MLHQLAYFVNPWAWRRRPPCSMLSIYGYVLNDERKHWWHTCTCVNVMCAGDGRVQKKLDADDENPAALESVGWRRIDGRWYCPFCCGTEAALYKVFNQSRPSGAEG